MTSEKNGTRPMTLLMKLALRQQRRIANGRRVSRATLVLAITVIGTIGAGIAYAFWTSNGTGIGSVNAGSPVALTVSPTTVNGAYPNEKTVVPLTVTNTNPYGVTLSDVTLGVTATGSGCNDTDVTLDSTAGGVSGSAYALSGSLSSAGGASPSANFNVPIAIANLANACQGSGHSFSLTFTVHGVSS